MDVIRKLMQGDVNCAVLNEAGIDYKLAEAGFTLADVRKEAVLIISSGRLVQIREKWFPDIDWWAKYWNKSG